MTTKIEWADETWNPVTGCTKISEGCQHCYAERMARRLAGRFGYPEMPHHFDVTVHEDKMDQPLRWKKPRRIFVCSMGDLFHEDVRFGTITQVFKTMIIARRHQFLVLTKRPKRMYEWAAWETGESGEDYPSGDNVVLGVTAENQQRADERIPILLQIPAAGHFVSLEPLLGPVELEPEWVEAGWYDGPFLDWVILGGESGPGARPMHPDWARGVRDQCQGAGMPFLFKQWGGPHHRGWVIDGQLYSGRLLDGREWNEYPEALQ